MSGHLSAAHLSQAVKKAYDELCASMRHEAERGLKTAKTAKETRDALSHLVDASPLMRTRLAPAQASEAALSKCWEVRAPVLPAKLCPCQPGEGE